MSKGKPILAFSDSTTEAEQMYNSLVNFSSKELTEEEEYQKAILMSMEENPSKQVEQFYSKRKIEEEEVKVSENPTYESGTKSSKLEVVNTPTNTNPSDNNNSNKESGVELIMVDSFAPNSRSFNLMGQDYNVPNPSPVDIDEIEEIIQMQRAEKVSSLMTGVSLNMFSSISGKQDNAFIGGDEYDDPELALAMQMSIEENKVFQPTVTPAFDNKEKGKEK